ncbi:glycine/D-amino acid oxidase-like deaminating enzyme [Paenibacillus cellulosilyticus]|uniref:Glycine/D-amino acid oxidase-like deaminating enzyme n=1 Tax=Paenibacillus cellulosilyticus TaxID=375489 RepID=A0A2V2YTC4_9BACL|nr:FAD-binding oxidoreductase [Paenibacillus cellulosilyticus]PWV99499.1 glycine/D-amino acid oxidase-like deaminating enzyme [Paenibacillus cellulosilyticus]QKS46484.1 FAD-binding oxidoreductase [Paenibacillus cellulosilyticus]
MKNVIVIGAGILGASTAYQLARSGAKVLLVDRQDQGQATAAAAGIICPWLSQRRNQVWYRLAKAGARYYPELIEQLHSDGETDTGYARVGALSIHEDIVKVDKMEERARLRREDAPEIGDISRHDENETIEQFPLLAEGYHAVRISGAARVDGRALRDAMISAAQRHGAELLHGDAKLVFDAAANRVTGVVVEGQTITADAVIVCAGAWARQLLQPLGIEFRVSYQKAQIIHLQVQDEYDTGAWPVIMPPTDQYLLGFEEQRIVIGATHENDVAGYDTRITAGGMQEVLNKGLSLAPALANSTVLETRVGFRPFTPGFLPVIGAIPGWDGAYAANGLGASGLTVGPYLGSQLAKLALGEALDIELSDYDIANAMSSDQVID